jgi:polar amino acid transport system substrate-binding protein
MTMRWAVGIGKNRPVGSANPTRRQVGLWLAGSAGLPVHSKLKLLTGTSAMPSDLIKSQLAPHGVLRAAINMGNFLLVTGKTESGDPDGVSPDMARAIAARLGVPVKFVPYAKPADLADAAGTDTWDIGNIGAEPQRAAKIAFSAAYAEIEATYLVPAGSTIKSIADVDQKGHRISVSKGSAYELWLERNIHNAELIRAPGGPQAFDAFVNEKMDALASLRPALLNDVKKLPGSRILDGQFASVQQAVGCNKSATEAAAFLAAFVEEAKKSGMVAGFIKKHGVEGRLTVAPLV